MPVFLYGCESWSLTLEEEHRLRLFENRVLRKIFGPKRGEIGELRKLRNEELHDMYSSPNIIRVIKSRIMRRMGHAALVGERRGTYVDFMVKSEGMRPLGRPRHRWENNIKMDIHDV